MTIISNFPADLLHKHHAWHGHGHAGFPGRTHQSPGPHSGEEFLSFHRDFMFEVRRWLASQNSTLDVEPWVTIPDELKDPNLGWTHEFAVQLDRLSQPGSTFASEDELGIIVENGIHNNFLHNAGAAASGDQVLLNPATSPLSTYFYKIHGLVQHWWSFWVEKRHAADGRVFSPSFYLGTYGDLRDAFGSDFGRARGHFGTFGFTENRRSASHFDVDFYLNREADLSATFGAEGSARAISHWIHHGIGEGRRASLIFDVQWYLQNHGDLAAAFGAGNFPSALQHWIDNGLNEGRRASTDFDVGFYLSSNPDLVAAFGPSGFEAAAAHWMEFGRGEGRKPVP